MCNLWTCDAVLLAVIAWLAGISGGNLFSHATVRFPLGIGVQTGDWLEISFSETRLTESEIAASFCRSRASIYILDPRYGGVNFIEHPAKLGYWYLFFLWQCYLLTHIYNNLVAKRMKENGKWRFIVDVAWLILFLLMVKVAARSSDLTSDTWGLFWLFQLYPIFLLRHIVQREGWLGKAFLWKQGWFDGALIGFVFFFALAVSLLKAREEMVLRMVAAPFVVYVIICLFVKYSGKVNRGKLWLESFGRHSLDIYVLHYFLIHSCHMVFIGKDDCWMSGNYFVIPLLALFITALIATICMAMSWLVRQSRLLAFILLGVK